ncbi:MAG TPA: serine hydrolase domain-containing protein [Candidatus Polarisedimenticolaceae bacterium]|nr:serine hydrolase domain-containing protein [Candidatus Polarisedimenticolaceae bacterium]
MKRLVSSALSATLFSAVLIAAAEAAPAPVVSGELGAKLDRYLNESGFVGSALVAKGGAIVLMKGYGLADRENGIPWSTDTVVSVGSITKQFTAAAILKLESEGKLSVKDPIGKFFKSAPPDKRGITLHQLLTHTSGLDSDFAGDYDPVGRDAYIDRIFGSKLRSAPGAAHFYANSGYSLLAAVVEIVSGQGYETYLREHLFLPAGMKETGYRAPQWDRARVPVGYRDGKRWGTMLEKPRSSDGPYWALRGNGGIETTLADLWAWNAVLDGASGVLPVATRKELFTPYVKESHGDGWYAYGWAISTTPWDTKLVEHDGGNGIFSADFKRYVDDGIVVITAASDAEIKAFKYSGALGRIAHGEDVRPERASAGKLRPIGDSPREQVVKKFVEAFNTHRLEDMRAFRSAHMVKREGGPTEQQRDEVTRRMFDDFGALAIQGVVAETGEEISVRMKPATAPPVLFGFVFDGEGKIAGLKVEAN